MSITELIEKINKIQTTATTVQKKQEIESDNCVTNLPDQKVITAIVASVDLDKLSSKELLDLSNQLTSWLETHECQTGTDNKLDINDRPYNHELYIKKLRMYGETYVEYFSRPLGEELEGIL